MTAALDPSPRSRGIRSTNVNRRPSTGARRRERAHAEMVDVELAVAVRHLELVPQVERHGGTVEARADVRRARRRANANRGHLDAASIASGSGSTVTGAGLRRAAVSGSFSPWPVTTQTTREPGSSSTPARAASPAADAGSQKTPSACASSLPRLEDRVVGERDDGSAGPLQRGVDVRRVRRLDDADRGRDGRRPLGGLPADELRHSDAALREPSRVRREVPTAAVRQGEHVGGAAERLDDLERGGLLALEPVGVQRVDVHVRPSSGELARRGERLVEAPAHLEHASAESACLRELPGRDGARRLEHDGDEPGARRVGRGRGGRVPRGRADDRVGAGFDGLRDGHRHPAILEASRSGSHPPT